MSFKILCDNCCVGTQKVTPHCLITIRILDILIIYDRMKILSISRYGFVKRKVESRDLEFKQSTQGK